MAVFAILIFEMCGTLHKQCGLAHFCSIDDIVSIGNCKLKKL
jgi:hypothetical protein